MKIALQILVGVLMGVVSVIVGYNLGLIMNRPGPPNWNTGVGILVLFVAAQLFAAFIYRRHISLQVFLGLALSAMFAIAWLYLGPFWEQLSPDGNSYAITWRSDSAFVLLVAVSQLISFWAFRKGIALQVLGGAVFCVVLAIPLLYSEITFFEKHLPDGSINIGWRADVLFFLLVAVTQGISFLVFRRIRAGGPCV